MKPLSSETYRKEKDIVERTVAGETILVPIRGRLADMQRIFALDDVGAYVWQQLEGNQSLDSICEGIADEFEVDTPQARADLGKFIEQLLSAGLIAESGKQP